jgi:hypothetical protein
VEIPYCTDRISWENYFLLLDQPVDKVIEFLLEGWVAVSAEVTHAPGKRQSQELVTGTWLYC